jgi:hypothetical protein
MYSDLCRLTTARFDVRSRNVDPTTALHSSVRAPACYVTRRQSRGSVIALGPVHIEAKAQVVTAYCIVQSGTSTQDINIG